VDWLLGATLLVGEAKHLTAELRQDDASAQRIVSEGSLMRTSPAAKTTAVGDPVVPVNARVASHN